jgi:hypothetical protein
VLPMVNQKSIGSAGIEISRSTRTRRIFRGKDVRYGVHRGRHHVTCAACPLDPRNEYEATRPK